VDVSYELKDSCLKVESGDTIPAQGAIIRLPNQQPSNMSMFKTSTQSAFKFLSQEFGFEARAKNDEVSYRKGELCIIVRYDLGRSYELVIDLGKEGQSDPMFDFGEALRSCNAPKEIASAYQVSSPESLPKFLEHLATSLKEYCGALLKSDEEAWKKLEQQREIECATFNEERELRYAREDASQAWDAGDFQLVVQLLSPFESLLNKAEQMRLSFARKKMLRTE